METNKFLISFGTKAEWLKIKPIIEKKRSLFHIIKINQHTDIFKGDNCFYDEEIEIEKVSGNRLNDIITSVLKFDISRFQNCIVQGDTCSTYSMCLNAFNRGLNIFHVEAGLRTYSSDPFPEESYRKSISSMSNIHFAPCSSHRLNLLKEGYDPESIYVTGNTSLDNLEEADTEYGDYVIISLHRSENLKSIIEILKTIDSIDIDLKFIYINHPNFKVSDQYRNIEITEKYLPHDDFINLLKDCKFLITDSGGIMEEASFFRKKTIELRKNSERQDSKDITLHSSVEVLKRDVTRVNNDYQVPKGYVCPYGNGNASSQILKIIKNV